MRGPARGGRQTSRRAGDVAKVRREIGETNGVRKRGKKKTTGARIAGRRKIANSEKEEASAERDREKPTVRGTQQI